jgi:hypothetical protein
VTGVISHHGFVAGRPRGFETVRDMVLSMALVGAVVAALFLVVEWQRPEVQGSIRPPVDVAGVVQGAAISAPFPVLAPTGVPDAWTPTSAWYEPAAGNGTLGGDLLHVGYETATGQYAEVMQSNGNSAIALHDFADDGSSQDKVTINGRPWQQRESASGTRSLMLLDTQHTAPIVIVDGTAGWDDLQQLASSLRQSSDPSS